MRTSQSPDGLQGNTVYETLLNHIQEGQLAPGDRLRETDLAARLGVSRTPIREAIRQLEADGLVTHLPRQGASIRRLEYAEVIELYEMRAVLEGTAARMATRAASEIELAELSAINDDLRHSSSAADAYRVNRMFHSALLDAAKNRFLIKSMNSLHRALMILGPTTLAEESRIQIVADEHARVLIAMRDRDADAAERQMIAHIDTSQQVRIRALRSLSPYAS
ncbi:GntR family transcriptional regulator [Shimia abyssi]|uniref:GntR family transcriptional regulator n=1 Tax=Shimia abyssi TaxID=1662395 RepID=A0A2P8F8Z7_9RHOB|nr:GntR family transcriptional regulator [Shimia abyssi]PSL18175.1 GntR family transcriptional regulator [Shimia abyssi]